MVGIKASQRERRLPQIYELADCSRFERLFETPRTRRAKKKLLQSKPKKQARNENKIPKRGRLGKKNVSASSRVKKAKVVKSKSLRGAARSVARQQKSTRTRVAVSAAPPGAAKTKLTCRPSTLSDNLLPPPAAFAPPAPSQTPSVCTSTDASRAVEERDFIESVACAISMYQGEFLDKAVTLRSSTLTVLGAASLVLHSSPKHEALAWYIIARCLRSSDRFRYPESPVPSTEPQYLTKQQCFERALTTAEGRHFLLDKPSLYFSCAVVQIESEAAMDAVHRLFCSSISATFLQTQSPPALTSASFAAVAVLASALLIIREPRNALPYMILARLMWSEKVQSITPDASLLKSLPVTKHFARQESFNCVNKTFTYQECLARATERGAPADYVVALCHTLQTNDDVILLTPFLNSAAHVGVVSAAPLRRLQVLSTFAFLDDVGNPAGIVAAMHVMNAFDAFPLPPLGVPVDRRMLAVYLLNKNVSIAAVDKAVAAMIVADGMRRGDTVEVGGSRFTSLQLLALAEHDFKESAVYTLAAAHSPAPFDSTSVPFKRFCDGAVLSQTELLIAAFDALRAKNFSDLHAVDFVRCIKQIESTCYAGASDETKTLHLYGPLLRIGYDRVAVLRQVLEHHKSPVALAELAMNPPESNIIDVPQKWVKRGHETRMSPVRAVLLAYSWCLQQGLRDAAIEAEVDRLIHTHAISRHFTVEGVALYR